MESTVHQDVAVDAGRAIWVAGLMSGAFAVVGALFLWNTSSNYDRSAHDIAAVVAIVVAGIGVLLVGFSCWSLVRGRPRWPS